MNLMKWILACGLILGCATVPLVSLQAQNREELVTEAELQAVRSKLPQYYKALGASSMTQADTALIKEMMRLQVLQLSMASKLTDLPELREKLKREIDLRAKPAAREVMLAAIVENSRKLLDHPLPVKLNAVMLITELNQDSGVMSQNIPPTPYQGMVDVLLEILNDPKQHEALKVAAAIGLQRVCRDSSPKIDVRQRIAETLVKELSRADTSEWYRMVCIQALARADVLNDSQRRPFIVHKLAEILVDPQQGWRARADAAHALARVPMDASINVPLILHEIARFAHEAGQQFNNNPNAPQWRYCAYQTYLTFKQEDLRDTALLDRVSKPQLSKHRNDVVGAYGVVLPIVNGIMEFDPPQKIDARRLEALKTWLDSNPPTNLSVSLDPNVKLKPLRAG